MFGEGETKGPESTSGRPMPLGGRTNASRNISFPSLETCPSKTGIPLNGPDERNAACRVIWVNAKGATTQKPIFFEHSHSSSRLGATGQKLPGFLSVIFGGCRGTAVRHTDQSHR